MTSLPPRSGKSGLWGWLLLLSGIVFVLAVMNIQDRFWKGKDHTIRLAINSAAIASAPIFVLQDAPGTRGSGPGVSDLERAAGVQVEAQGFPSGKLALDALLSGAVDAATAAETPIVLAVQHPELRILATITTSQFRVVADTLKGVAHLSDLRGRSVGVPVGTSAEFFLDRMLASAALDSSAVKVIPMQPGDLVSAFARGDIDAASIWEPLASRAMTTRKTAMAFDGEQLYSEHFVIVTTASKLSEKGLEFDRLITGLIGASEFIRTNPTESIRIVSRRIQIDATELDAIWGRFDFPVALTDDLLTTMSNVEGWAAHRAGREPRSQAELKALVAQDPLRRVAEKRVTFDP